MQIAATQGINAAATDKQRTAKLADGAHQFEAMMLQQMMKGLKFSSAPGEADDPDGEGNALESYGTQALAKAMADSGGFGIARQIIRQVSAEDQSKGSGRGKV